MTHTWANNMRISMFLLQKSVVTVFYDAKVSRDYIYRFVHFLNLTYKAKKGQMLLKKAIKLRAYRKA